MVAQTLEVQFPFFMSFYVHRPKHLSPLFVMRLMFSACKQFEQYITAETQGNISFILNLSSNFKNFNAETIFNYPLKLFQNSLVQGSRATASAKTPGSISVSKSKKSENASHLNNKVQLSWLEFREYKVSNNSTLRD